MEKDNETIKSSLGKVRNMAQEWGDNFEKIFEEIEKLRLHLEAEKKRLDEREEELQRRDAQITTKRAKQLLDMIEDQNKAEENMLRLAEEHKKEMEKLDRRVIQLQKELDAKQASLELETERMKEALNVMKHIEGEEEKKMDEVEEEFNEKIKELDHMESLCQNLILQERCSNDDLQEARKELISSFTERKTRAAIGVKNMGELDGNPFLAAMKEIYPHDEAFEKALMLCSLWENHLKDPSWHPFKIVMDDTGNAKEIIDENDEKLKNLKDECGERALTAVTKALIEMYEYNPSGRHAIRELWNFQEKRKASLKEGVSYILRKWREPKRKRIES